MDAILIPLAAYNWAGAWASAWGPIQASAPKFWSLLNIVGLCIVAWAIVSAVIQKQRGSINWTTFSVKLLLGMICSGPNTVLPIFLKIADGLANGAARILS